jgi:hypothetical protein
MDGVVSFQGGFALVNRQVIIDFAAAQRLPAIYQLDKILRARMLASYRCSIRPVIS